jgi:hypothetical protein
MFRIKEVKTMDDEQYRKQYQEQLQRAAAQQTSYRDLLTSSKSAPMVLGIEAVAPGEQNELAELTQLIRDKNQDVELRIKALDAISHEAGEHDELFDLALELLQDTDEPDQLRRSALTFLQQISFGSASFAAKRPGYLAALRSVVDDPDRTLRQQAMGILAREKDEYVQRRLLEGLEDRSKALIPPAKAIQLLSYDIHAEHYPILRQIVQQPPNRAAKKEAVSLLAADTASKDLLIDILKDKGESSEIRTISAIALQSLAPTEFEGLAEAIALDNSEDNALRAACINALAHFANPAVLSEESPLSERIEQLSKQTNSRYLKQAMRSYMAQRKG